MSIVIDVLLGLTFLQSPGVDIRVAASPGGFVDAELKRRQDSALDLEKELQRLGVKRKSISQLEVMVLESVREATEGKVEMRNRPEILGGGQRAEIVAGQAYVLRVKLKFAEYEKTFTGRSVGDVPTWTNAARDVARQVREWLQDNGGQVCRESPISCG